MEEDKKKRGRPKKGDALRARLTGVRISEEEALRLKNAVKRSGFSQADIVRFGMSMFIDKIEKQFPEERHYHPESDYYEEY